MIHGKVQEQIRIPVYHYKSQQLIHVLIKVIIHDPIHPLMKHQQIRKMIHSMKMNKIIKKIIMKNILIQFNLRMIVDDLDLHQ
jgi:hypothetical protein